MDALVCPPAHGQRFFQGPASCRPFLDMTQTELADVLAALGCPQEKSGEMAGQLDKRARQLAESQNRSYEDALAHLLQLMRQGWAARELGH